MKLSPRNYIAYTLFCLHENYKHTIHDLILKFISEDLHIIIIILSLNDFFELFLLKMPGTTTRTSNYV